MEANFKNFTIDNHKAMFKAHGFTKRKDKHEYECEYCNDIHYANVFEKNGRAYYFNIELHQVIKLGCPD